MNTKRKSRGPQVLAVTQRNAFKVVAEAVAIGEQVAKQLARVDTGWMRDHTRGETDGQGHGLLECYDTPHGIYNEFGTSKMSAKPFMRPGSDAVVQYIRRNLRVKA